MLPSPAMSKKPWRRRIFSRRSTAGAAMVTGALEAYGIVTTFFAKGSLLIPLFGFFLFVFFVVMHILELNNEIDDRDDALANRERRRWIREQLDKYGDEYKGIMDGEDLKATLAIDERFKAFVGSNEEVTGYWSVINSGAHLPPKPIPEWIKTDAQKRVWHKCQTRRYHIANIIVDFKD